MKTLTLQVKREFFEDMVAGRKPFEFRLDNAYWRKRLTQPVWTCAGLEFRPREFDRLVITWGYPKRTDTTRRLEFPWRGFEMQTITHHHFKNKPERVFAIRLEQP